MGIEDDERRDISQLRIHIEHLAAIIRPLVVIS